jgi:hypothetical protein
MTAADASMTDNTGTPADAGTPADPGARADAGARADTGTRAGTSAGRGKPTPADLGIDPATLRWGRSGAGEGAIEIAFPENPARWARGDWVLMRVTGDTEGRTLVFDRNEWECFLDGVRNGEFDDAAE